MAKLLFFIITIAFFSCNDNTQTVTKPTTVNADTIIKPYIFDCFKTVDSTKKMYAKACSNFFYKVIDKKYVLVLQTNIPVQYDSCVKIIIDTTNSVKFAELIVFKDGEANFLRYCNDYGNNIIPIKSLKKAYGEIYVKFYKPTEYHGTDDPTASIFVHYLVFIDSAGNSTFTIDNELYWKVFQYGPFG